MNQHPLLQRIKRNAQRLKTFIIQQNLDAYRLYNKDIPEYPFIIDRYQNYFIVQEKGKSELAPELLDKRFQTIQILQEGLGLLFEQPSENIFFKYRYQQDRANQYRKEKDSLKVLVREGILKFEVDLLQYMDTGLFLDHRPWRRYLLKYGKDKTALNLFSYTGSLSVALAMAGAKVCSVDMSPTYLDWAKRNFEHNEINLNNHQFIQADILQYIQRPQAKYNLVIVDPPSFSNSKKMNQTWDIQRDHQELLISCSKWLTANGKILFSTNKEKFKLNPELHSHFVIEETTEKTHDPDFNKKAHKTFELSLI